MAKKKPIYDGVFGRLTHVVGDLWERPIELQIFGRSWTVPLAVNIDPIDGIEAQQITAYRIFIDNQDVIIAAAERAVFDYYQSVCQEYRSRYGIVNTDHENVPLIKAKRDVYRLVKLDLKQAKAVEVFGRSPCRISDDTFPALPALAAA